LLALLALLTLAGVGQRATGVGEPAMRGFIIAVEARDIGHAETITLRDGQGREHRFQVADSVDAHWTPGHLREHMAFGDLITVYYRQDGGALVAMRITD
jgi:hypothetical protein